MWLWPPLMQRELDKFRCLANNRRVRKQKDKICPSGTTPNFAYTFPESFGGRDCLQPVDVNVIDEILADMVDEHRALTDWGVPEDFAQRAKLGVRRLGFDLAQMEMVNVWTVFAAVSGVLQG
jgi:hypothetical protein